MTIECNITRDKKVSDFETEVLDRLTKLENKTDLLSQQNEAIQKAIANIRGDFREIVKESIKSVLNRRAIEGYSQIAGGRG